MEQVSPEGVNYSPQIPYKAQPEDIFGVNVTLTTLYLGGRLTSDPDAYEIKSYCYLSKGELELLRKAASG